MKKSIEINTFYKLIGGLNQLGIEAGTNAPKGGDSGAGGRTFLKLSEEGGTAWDVTVIDEYGNEQTIESIPLYTSPKIASFNRAGARDGMGREGI